jgi:hypothetical protein
MTQAMSEKRIDMPETRSTAGQPLRKPFVQPTVQDLGGLTLVTLLTSIPT